MTSPAPGKTKAGRHPQRPVVIAGALAALVVMFLIRRQRGGGSNVAFAPAAGGGGGGGSTTDDTLIRFDALANELADVHDLTALNAAQIVALEAVQPPLRGVVVDETPRGGEPAAPPPPYAVAVASALTSTPDYALIASQLPGSGAGQGFALENAVLQNPGFDFVALTERLGVPSTAEIEALMEAYGRGGGR